VNFPMNDYALAGRAYLRLEKYEQSIECFKTAGTMTGERYKKIIEARIASVLALKALSYVVVTKSECNERGKLEEKLVVTQEHD